MKPPKSILDPTFVYVPEAQTDVRKTFARIRREQKAQAEQPKVVPLKKAKSS